MVRLKSTTARLLLLSALASFASSAPAKEPTANHKAGFPQVRHMIDTHIHLYDTRRPDGVPWPRAHDKVLYKPHLPAEFNRVSQPTGVTGVVIVEASDRLDDNRWLLDLVKDDHYYVGVVGNVDLRREDFDRQLQALTTDRRFVGIRARNPQAYDFSNPRVLQNLRKLAKRGLTLDLLTNGQGVAGVRQVEYVATRVPDLRIVANHVLGYDVDGKPVDEQWVAAVEQLAQNRNVYCKISGLFQRCEPQPAVRDIEHYRPVLDVLWQHFGKRRLIYGSNWPCTKKSGDYASYVRLVTSYFSAKGQEACELYFWKNANEAYRLNLPGG